VVACSAVAAAVGTGAAILASFSSLSINLQLLLTLAAMLLAGLLAAHQAHESPEVWSSFEKKGGSDAYHEGLPRADTPVTPHAAAGKAPGGGPSAGA